MKEEKADKEVKRLLRVKHTLYFRELMDGVLGWSEEDADIIDLDPVNADRNNPLAKTYLHELIHLDRPDWSEKRVLRQEKRLWRSCSWRIKALLYQKLGGGQIGGYYRGNS